MLICTIPDIAKTLLYGFVLGGCVATAIIAKFFEVKRRKRKP